MGDGRNRIKSIATTDDVESIVSMAFSFYTELRSLYISKGVRSILPAITAGCDKLQSIIVDPKNPYYDSRDGCNAIVETSTNTLIAGSPHSFIPRGVQLIGRLSFNHLTELRNVSIPSSVVEIQKRAFSDCPSIESITVDPENPVYDSRNNCYGIIETSSNSLILRGLHTTVPPGVTDLSGSYSPCKISPTGEIMDFKSFVHTVRSANEYRELLRDMTCPLVIQMDASECKASQESLKHFFEKSAAEYSSRAKFLFINNSPRSTSTLTIYNGNDVIGHRSYASSRHNEGEWTDLRKYWDITAIPTYIIIYNRNGEFFKISDGFSKDTQLQKESELSEAINRAITLFNESK